MTRSADARFDEKWVLDPATGCHLWIAGCTASYGYGAFWYDGKMGRAHVFAYERKYGPVPAGTELDHYFCETPPCCNPDHVRPATHRENLLRSNNQVARQAAQTHCKDGHELSGDNLLQRKNGKRDCKTCHRERYHRNNYAEKRRQHRATGNHRQTSGTL